jgi:hypothetical protein
MLRVPAAEVHVKIFVSINSDKVSCYLGRLLCV